jgi:hypothetical protein
MKGVDVGLKTKKKAAGAGAGAGEIARGALGSDAGHGRVGRGLDRAELGRCGRVGCGARGLGELRWLGRGIGVVALAAARGRRWVGRASWAGRPGRSDSFFLLKLEIHFGVSNKIGKMQMWYRWIRYEKYFNMRLNLEQKYKLYKTKI